MRERINFGAVILISISLIFIGRSDYGKKLQLNLSSVFSPIQSFTSFFFNTLRIRNENKILRQKVVELSLENQSLYSYKLENVELHRLLEFREQTGYTAIPANITNRELDPISEVCTIDKGSINGMQMGMPVITEDGIYGKIIEVTNDKSLVQTLFNFNFRASGMDLKSGVQGIVRWESGKGCILEQIPVNSEIEPEDKIITSGLGSVFPRGINIGTVKKISIDASKLFYSISLKPACEFSKVTNVFVLKESILIPDSLKDSVMIKTVGWEFKKTSINKIETPITQEPENKPALRPPLYPIIKPDSSKPSVLDTMSGIE